MTDKPRKIVIVDDEPDTAEMFAEMMRLRGYDVHKCFEGEAAKTLIQQINPDLVVLDVMIPDLSGIDVLKWIRKNEELADIPVVLVSAKTLPEDIRNGLNAGATVYLPKPVAYQDFIEAVSRALWQA